MARAATDARVDAAPGLWERNALWLLVGHVPLGVLLLRSPSLAALHGLVVVGLGIVALTRRVESLVAVCAYVSSSEVLWRMAQAPLPYEFGKYAITLLCGAGLLRLGKQARIRWLPILYFGTLLPSTLASLINPEISASSVSDNVRFYLSGPLALCMSVWLLSQIRLKERRMREVLLAIALPCAAMAAATGYATATATDLVFSTESNFITSGGFGPNQVSTSLGLGVVACLLITMNRGFTLSVRWMALTLIFALSVAAAMTFSRGGLYGAAGAILVASFYLVRIRRVRLTFILVLTAVSAGGAFFVWPRLNTFTGGSISARFSDIEPTSRGTLVLDDVRMFLADPVLGVGPGQARAHRALIPYGMGHTEFTRMLGEHGIFGAVSVVLLLTMAWRAVSRREATFTRGIRASMLAWSLLSMLHVAMRIAAISFFFGLAFLQEDAPQASSRGG